MDLPINKDDVISLKTYGNGNEGEEFDRTKAARAILTKMTLAMEVSDVKEKAPEIWYYEGGRWHPRGAQLISYFLDTAAENHSDFRNIEEVLRRIRGELRLRPVVFDVTNPYLIGCEGGITLDLRTGKARKAMPTDLISMPIPVKFDPSAKCPEFIKFLHAVSATDDDILGSIDFLASLLIAQPMDFFICAPGNGSNGRSTLKDLIGRFLGEDAVRRIPLAQLKERFTNSFLKSCRVNYCSETEVSAVALDHIKRSGERMPVEVKFGGMQNVLLYLKYFFDTNQMPRIADNSYGAERRLVKLDYCYRFVDNPEDPMEKLRDPYILDKISTPEELSGILNLVLLRTYEVIQKKMIHKKPDGLAEYGLQSRSGDVFIELFVDEADTSKKVFSSTLRQAYKEYCFVTNSATMGNKGFRSVLFEKTNKRYEKSIRIGEKVSNGYSGLSFDQELFDGTMETLRKARETGGSVFQALITMFPNLDEDFNYTKLHTYYTNSKATDIVCSICSKCSIEYSSLREKNGRNPISPYKEKLEEHTTLQILQSQSFAADECSKKNSAKITSSPDVSFEASENHYNVVQKFLADGGKSSLEWLLAEFPEANI